MTTKEVSEIFKVTVKTVRDWINEKRLGAIKFDNGHLRVPKSELIKFANERYEGISKND